MSLTAIFRESMGLVRVKALIWNIENPDRRCEVEFIVDTSAIYTVIPSSTLEKLGVKRMYRRRFSLADNRVVERDIGLIGIRIGDRETHTIAVFGEEGLFLLGVYTLEGLGLEVDPVTGKLKEMELLLL